MKPLDLDTPHGTARVHWLRVEGERGVLALGHGAGGSVEAKDLVAVRDAAVGIGVSVALVEQPYRVAGRKSAAPATQLDVAWVSVIGQLDVDVPLVVGGRSSGARVACRTAAEVGAVGVLCLAFPVHPPGKPEKTRLDELDGVKVPVLVVQGERDPFGMPPKKRGRKLVTVQGTHALAQFDVVAAAASDWLAKLLA